MKAKDVPVLAWFVLDGAMTPTRFAGLVASAGAIYEGSGVDKRTNHIEGFVVFASRAKCDSFSRHNAKHGCLYIDSVV